MLIGLRLPLCLETCNGPRVVSFLPWLNNTPGGQGPLIVEASRSHSDTPHFVGLLWKNDRPIAET